MFTGIVSEVGRIRRVEPRAGDLRLLVEVTALPPERMRPGDSICVSGVCLTVTAADARGFAADVSRETLACTTLAALAPGSEVNIEAALRAGDPLGGHLVSGHVDGIAEVVALAPDARSTRVRIRVPAALARYVAPKGSVAIDGVSLTVNEVDGEIFGINLIPHTQAVTTLGRLRAGQKVNLEVDQVARYVERLLAPSIAASTQGSSSL